MIALTVRQHVDAKMVNATRLPYSYLEREREREMLTRERPISFLPSAAVKERKTVNTVNMSTSYLIRICQHLVNIRSTTAGARRGGRRG